MRKRPVEMAWHGGLRLRERSQRSLRRFREAWVGMQSKEEAAPLGFSREAGIELHHCTPFGPVAHEGERAPAPPHSARMAGENVGSAEGPPNPLGIENPPQIGQGAVEGKSEEKEPSGTV